MSRLPRECLDSEGCLLFGKHKGETAESVARSDPAYLSWLLENIEDLDEGDAEILEALQERRR